MTHNTPNREQSPSCLASSVVSFIDPVRTLETDGEGVLSGR